MIFLSFQHQQYQNIFTLHKNFHSLYFIQRALITHVFGLALEAINHQYLGVLREIIARWFLVPDLRAAITLNHIEAFVHALQELFVQVNE